MSKSPSARTSRTSRTSKSSYGVKHWYSQKLAQNNNIFNFTIPENLKSSISYNKTNHHSFNTFFEDEINNKESLFLDLDNKNDNSDIITIHNYHSIDNQDKLYLEKLKEIYTKNYLSRLPDTNFKNKKGQNYPFYQKDLIDKTNVIYEEFEKTYDIDKPIENQIDSEFLQTLKNRLKGLKKCSEDPDETLERKTFYKTQLQNETLNLESLKMNKTKSDIDKIKEQCKSIYWNKVTYDKLITEFDIEKFKTFLIKDNYLQFNLLKTFLPKELFLSNQNIDSLITKIYDSIIKIKNRTYRQYIFGFGSDIKETYFPFRPFLYEIQSMMAGLDYKYICDKFVNWNIMLNLVFNMCSISNTDILFPARFIIPKHNYSLVDKNNNSKGIKIRFIKKQYDLFDDTQTKFIGIISIKNIYINPITKHMNKRLMILFIFKNKNKEHFDRFDTLQGIIPEYFTVNERLRFLNEGSILSHPNITHTELKHFMNLSKYNNITQTKPKIRLFTSNLNNNIIFMANTDYKNPINNNDLDTELNLDFYKDLELFEIEINKKNDTKKNEDAQNTEYFEFIPKHKPLSGGSLINDNAIINYHLKIQTTKKDTNLYKSNPFISGYSYNKFLDQVEQTITMFLTDKNYNEKYTLSTKSLYNYLLISNNEINIQANKFNPKDKSLTITKYIPITTKFFYVAEIFNKFNIFNINKKDNILLFSYDLNYIEYIKYNNYKINNITTVVPVINKILYNDELIKYINYINTVKNIYDIQIINYNDNLYTLPKTHIETIKNKYNIVIYTLYQFDKNLFMYENYLNLPNIFIGALVGLKYTEIGGTFILNFGSVAYKHLADIYLIVSQYFEVHHLYYPEISNLFKKTGTQGIFKKFIGIKDNDYNNLLKILNNIEKIYPNGSNDFNIYDLEIRKKYKITKPIDVILQNKYKYIVGFLDTKPNNPIYDTIKKFNEERYLQQYIYMTKLLTYLNKPLKELKTIKIPTQDQIVSSILYCRKYDIPIFDKYSITTQNSIITKTILHDMYGLHEPILYKFRTLFQTHIIGKIVVNPKFKLLSRTKSKSQSILKSSLFKSKKLKITKTKRKSLSFLNNLFANDNTTSFKHKSHKKYVSKNKSKTHKLSKSKKHTKPNKSLTHSNMSLEDAITYSNNSLIQVGRLMDVRKDFFTTDDPNKLYYMLKEQFRYYKATTPRNVQNLDKKIQFLLKDYNISQAWLKMYEIITDCNLIPTNRKGTYKSFHICEAPGTFISCINNYIHTKTSYDSFEWKSQSLKPRGAKSLATTIGDTYGFIKKYPEHWDFGVDDTGDITNIENIKYYAQMAKDMNINLMTSDCGLPMGDTKYYQVAYASYVSILYSLPQNGTLLYKILSPIDVPLIWNLIYITYTNFKEMYFFKPVQNSQSREFYIIGKGYLGLEQNVLEQLLNLIPKFEDPGFNKEEYDLFNDTYPEEFVIQVQNSCERLASNYVNSIERIIYYVDNIDALGKDYEKHIESYMKEKNEDWIRKYKPMRVDKNFIL